MKKKVLLTSILSIACCASLITGATFALFTSESNVNIAVTSGKVDVKATIDKTSLETYSGKWNAETGAYDSVKQTEKGAFVNGGTAVIEGSTLTLDKMTPMDKATFKIDITNNSNVAFKQRISFSCADADQGFFDQLLVGLSDNGTDYTYYGDYTTAWETGAAVAEVPEVTYKYMSIELPEYVGNAWQGKICNLSVSVEAIQGNAVTTGDASASLVRLANTQAELDAAVAEMKDGDTVVLSGGEWTTANISYQDAKAIKVQGYKVGTMTINAPNGSVALYCDAETLNVEAIASSSLHVYGKVNALTLNQGRAVLETGAAVTAVKAAPAAEQTAKIEIAEKVEVSSVVIAPADPAAKIEIVNAGTVAELTAEGAPSSDNTVIFNENAGNIIVNNVSDVSVGTITNGMIKVGDENTLTAALAIAGETDEILLTNNITLAKAIEITRSVTINGGDGKYSLSVPNGDSNRVINLNDTVDPVSLKLINVKIVGPTSGSYTRGISVYRNKEVTISIDGCEISAYYYAINIASENEKVTLDVKNSTISGWAAFQTHSPINATFENCTLNGLNDKGYNADGWNNFQTVVINEGGVGSNVTFNACTLTAKQTTGNRQYIFSMRSKAVLDCKNCTYELDANDNLTSLLSITTSVPGSCTFDTDPTAYLEEGYAVEKTADNKWNVVPKFAIASMYETGRIEMEVLGQSFIFEVTDSNAFADLDNGCDVVIEELGAVCPTDTADVIAVTVGDKVTYYHLTIEGLKTTGDAGWPNLYVKGATDVTFTENAGNTLDYCGFGYPATMEGYEGNWFVFGGIYYATANP